MAENNYCKTSYIPTAPSDNDDTSTNKNLLSNSIFVDKFQDALTNFEKAVVFDDAKKIISPSFNEAAVALNNAVTSHRDTINKDYPNIANRIELTPFITPVEIEDFTTDYYYDPVIFTDIISRPITSNDTKNTFQKLDYFFSPENVSTRRMGSFCALVPSIFAGIQEFHNFFDNIKVMAGDIAKFIGQISDFSVSGLVETIKKQVESVIDEITKEIKAKMERFGFSFIDNKIGFSNQRIMSKIQSMRSDVESFFSEENIQDIKDQINGLLAYALSLFEKPSIEEIQYLIYRFCALIGQVETIMTGVTTPLDNTVRDYSSIRQILTDKSGINTARAQSAGALRYASPVVSTKTNSFREQATARVQQSGRYTPLTPQDYEGIVPWNDGNGIPGKITFPAKLGGMKQAGWDGLRPEVKAYFCRGQSVFGKELRVNSAYRSPAYNATIKNAAPRSMHMSGEAIDASFDSIQNKSLREEYLEIMYNAGFEWFNWYPNESFLHIDVKRRGGHANDLVRRFGDRKSLVVATPALILPQSTAI